jgi:hypothetical protein
MEMRKLTNPELDQVKRAIAYKDITSAEILMEIFDHYLSHLQSYEEQDFEEQLLELEQQFTYSYCHALQAKFLNASKKEIFHLQWNLFKTYFTWPRMLGTVLFLCAYIFLWGTIEAKTKGLILVIPLVVVLCLSGWIWIKSYKKVREIKRIVNAQNKIESSYLSTIMVQFSLMTSSFNLLICVPKILDVPNFLDSVFFLVASFSLFILYTGYTLTLFEAWRLKTKTALI